MTVAVKVRISQCKPYVQALVPFHTGRSPDTATLWGEWDGDQYVVLSCNNRVPIYIHWRGVWFSNPFGPSKGSHRAYAHPGGDTFSLSTLEMHAFWRDERLLPSTVARLSKTDPMPDSLLAILTAAKIGALP